MLKLNIFSKQECPFFLCISFYKTSVNMKLKNVDVKVWSSFLRNYENITHVINILICERVFKWNKSEIKNESEIKIKSEIKNLIIDWFLLWFVFRSVKDNKTSR